MKHYVKRSIFPSVYTHILSFFFFFPRSENSNFQSLSRLGEGCEGLFAGPDSESEGRQSEAAGGISERLGQTEEIHRVGFQHHRHELTLTMQCYIAMLRMQYDSSSVTLSMIAHDYELEGLDKNPACVSVPLKCGWVRVDVPLRVPDVIGRFHSFSNRRTSVVYDTFWWLFVCFIAHFPHCRLIFSDAISV